MEGMDLEQASLLGRTTPQTPPDRRWRHAAGAMLALMAAGAVVASLLTSAPHAAASAPALVAEEGMQGLKITVHREHYSALSHHTLEAYGTWDLIVEPYCKMIFKVDNPPHNKYDWTIKRKTGNATFFLGSGSTVEVEFTDSDVNQLFLVTLKTPDGAKTWDTVVKYVRREIRNLTAGDRDEYLDTLLTVFTTEQAEGEKLYGSKFLSYVHLVALHNSDVYKYHDNLFFQTSHPAMQLKLEASLRAVTPGVQTPYWDFMIDHELGSNWVNSIIYDEDWFGSVNNAARPNGRFREVKHVLDLDSTQFPDAYHNPYGYLHDKRNVNNMQYLMRTNRVCDFGTELPFSSGNELRACFRNFTSLYEWDICLESQVHGDLHQMHSGMVECSESWQTYYDDNKDWLPAGMLSLAANDLENLISSSRNEKWLSCPSQCSVETDTFATCHCEVDSKYTGITSAKQIDDWTEEELYDFLGWWLKNLANNKYKGSDWIRYDSGTDQYVWKGISSEENVKLNKFLVKTVAYPGMWGSMGSGAASNEPLFWVMHQVFEKSQAALRLSPLYNKLDLTWNNKDEDDTDGYGWKSKTPFKAEIFEPYLDGLLPNDEVLTNEQLWALLDPKGYALPHVFDQFTTWGNVDFDPFTEGLW